MSEVKHSPLPYTVEDGETVKIKDANGDSILSMFHTHLRGCRNPGEVRATADLIVRAVNCHDKLVAALDGMVMVCGRTGSSLEDFEEQAEAFYQETRFMRPGKSMPMGGGGEHDDDIRRDKFNAWVKSKIAAGRTALASLKED